MDAVVTASCLLTVSLLAFSLLVVWVLRDNGWARTIAILAALASAPVSFGTEFWVLGRATVPVSGINFPRGQKVPVLGFKLDEGKAIYLLLDVPNGPMLYQVPWNKDEAKMMQQMQQEGRPMEAGADGKPGKPGRDGSVGTEAGISVSGRPDPRSDLPAKKSEGTGQTFSVGG